MAQQINNPNAAMNGLQFAIGGGRLPWNTLGGGGTDGMHGGQPFPDYNMGPSGPPPVTMGVGPAAQPMGGPVTDGMKPLGAPMPGKGGPADVMGRLDKLESDASPIMGGGSPRQMPGSKTMPMGAPMGGDVRKSAMKGLTSAMGGMY